MNGDFSVKQALACLNVSVFNPLKEPDLNKACRNEAACFAAHKKRFSDTASVVFLFLAATVCFAGLRPFALPAGIVLSLFCGIAARQAENDAVRFFFKAFAFAGLFLLADVLFRLSAPALTILLAVLTVRSFFRPKAVEKRLLFSVMLFVSALAQDPSAPIMPILIFSGLSSVGLLFVLKNTRWQESAVIFSIGSLAAYFIFEFHALSVDAHLQEKTLWPAIVAAAEAGLLLFRLRKDLEAGEIALALLFIGGVFFIAAFVSGGAALATVLFLTAYFVDLRILGRLAAGFTAGFLILYLLFLPADFLTAGLFSLTAAGVFAVLRGCLKRAVLQRGA